MQNRPWMKHKIPPTARKWWWGNPHDVLDCEFDIAPTIRRVKATAKMIHEKTNAAVAICLSADACSNSSLEQMQVQPPSRLAMAWANARSVAAASPSLNAWCTGALHSKIKTLKYFPLFCAIVASIPSTPAGERENCGLLFGMDYIPIEMSAALCEDLTVIMS